MVVAAACQAGTAVQATLLMASQQLIDCDHAAPIIDRY